MRVALDTNLLAYAEGVNGAIRQAEARDIISDASRHEILLPVQVIGELFALLIRKARRSVPAARATASEWADSYGTIGTSARVMRDGLELAATHRLALWDAVIVAAAAEADCRVLLTEDVRDGFTWRGVTLRNPFAGA